MISGLSNLTVLGLSHYSTDMPVGLSIELVEEAVSEPSLKERGGLEV